MAIDKEEIKRTAIELAERFTYRDPFGHSGVIFALKMLPTLYHDMRRDFKQRLIDKSITREQVKRELLIFKFIKIYLEKLLLSSPNHLSH